MIVLSVWGDHAFFYKGTHGAQTLKVAPVEKIPEVKLACRVDYEAIPYDEMEPWSPDATGKHLRTTRIGDALEFLRSSNKTFKVKYKTSSSISSIRVGDVRIRSVPFAAELFQRISERISELMSKRNHPFKYLGEAEGAFATRLMEKLLSKRRPNRVNREAVFDREKGLCGACGDPLDSEYEVHHVTSCLLYTSPSPRDS